MKNKLYLVMLFWLSANLIFPYSIFALPQNGSTVSGQVDISNSVNVLNIHQHSQKAIINWQSFDIHSGERVQFVQPNIDAAILNRVTGFQPSLINGLLTANGNVFLVNPNGIIIGADGIIQTHGFIGSTLNIDDTDFLNERFIFNFQPGAPLGKIINRGLISSHDSGYVSLLSPDIQNHGTIMVNMGKIHLAAGEKVQLSFVENNLISFAIDPKDMPSTTKSTIDNSGQINAKAGEVLMEAQTASDLVHSVVNNSGVIEAKSLVNDNGVIRLTGADEIQNTGKIDVSGETGGQIDISAHTIMITEDANINASGDTGGGTIRIGGGLHGDDESIPNAHNTFVGKNTLIQANANESGDGGNIFLWSDNTTIFTGSIAANGGKRFGNGGFVEVSGKKQLYFDGQVSTKAHNGLNGSLLLDPQKIYIVDGSTDDLSNDFSGQINFNDIPDELTIAEKRLENLSANTDIILKANDRISIMDLDDNELTLDQTGSVSFISGEGGFMMEGYLSDTIYVSGGGNLLINAFGSENNAYPATDGPITALGTIRTVGIGSVTLQGTRINLYGPINAGGTVTINNRDILNVQNDITSINGAFLQKGPRPVVLGANITATDEISFTHDISLSKKTTRLTSRDGSILLMNSTIGSNLDDCELILDAESVVSINDIDIPTLTFANMNGGLILNGNIQIKSAFDTTPVSGLMSVDEDAAIYTDNKPVIFNSSLSLKAPLTIHSGDLSGDIAFNDRIDGTFMLDLTAGTGNIYFQKDVGKQTMLNDLYIRSAQNVRVNGDILSDSIVDLNYAGLLTQGGAIRTTADNILLHGNVQLIGNSAYDTTIQGGNLHIMGKLDSTNSLEQSLDITTGTGNITINGAVGSVSIPGNIHISSAHNLTVDGPFKANSLLHPSGTGHIHFKDTVTTYDGGIHLHGLRLTLDQALNSNNSPIVLAANSFELLGEVQALNSSVTLYAHSAATTIGIEDASKDIPFTNETLHNLKTDQIIIGHVDNTGGITIAKDNNISQYKQLQFVSSGPISIRGNITTGNNSLVIITNYDSLYVAPGANLSLDGGWLQNGDGPVQIGGAITTIDKNIRFDGPVSLGGNLSLNTGDGEGNIHFTHKIDGNYHLSANSGFGNIVFEHQVGAEIPLYGLTLKSSAEIQIGSQFHAGSMTINNNGVLRLTDGADIQLNNAFSQQGIGPVELAGKITTANEDITFTQPVTLIGNATLNTGSGGGNILFQESLDGNHMMTLIAGDGNITINKKIGDTTLLAGLLIKSGNEISFKESIVVGQESLDITAKKITLIAPITIKDGGLLALENTDLLSISENALLTLEGAFYQRSTGPVNLSTNIITTGDDINIKGPLTLTKDVTFDTGIDAEGDIILSGSVTSDHLIAMNSGTGDIQFDQELSARGLEIQSANTVTVNGETTMDDAGINASAKTIEINNHVTTMNSGSMQLNIDDGDGGLNFSPGTTITVDGAFKQTGNANVNLGASIQTHDQSISFDGNITLSGNSLLTTGDNSGDILFEGEIDGTKDAINRLSLNAGTGNIMMNGNLGRNQLFDLTIMSGQNVSIEAPSRLHTYVQESGTGLTHIKETLYLGANGFSFKGKDLSFEKDISCNTNIPGIGMQITHSRQLIIKPNTTISLTGEFTQAGDGSFALGGNIQTVSAPITINGPITLIDNASIQSMENGNIDIQQTVDSSATGSYQLNLSAGSGELTFGAPIGSHSALKGLSVADAAVIHLDVPVITAQSGIQLISEQIESSDNWFTNKGPITITADILSQGDWQTNGGEISINGNTQSNGNWTTAGGKISIQGNTQSSGNWITAGGDISIDGNIQTMGDWQTGAGNISVDGDMTTSGNWTTERGNIDINGKTTLSDNIQWQTNNGNIQINGTVNGVEAYNQSMTMDAGTGDIEFQDTLGADTQLKNVDIQSATHVRIQSDVYADRFRQVAMNGQTHTKGAIKTNANGIYIQNTSLILEGHLDSNGHDMELIADQMTLPSVIRASGASVRLMPLSSDATIGIENDHQTLVFNDAALDGIDTAHLIFGHSTYNGSIFVGTNNQSLFNQHKNISLITTANITIRGALSTEYQNHLILDHGQQLSVDATIALNGNFLEKGSGTVDWSGSLLGTGDITFNQPITLKGDTTWRSSDGQINILQTIDGPHTVNVNAGTGSVQFAQNIGKTSPLTAIDVVSGILDTKEIHTSNLGIHINAEAIQLNGDISTLQGPVVFDGNVSIMSDLRMETSGGRVDFNGQLTDSDNNRILHMATADGNISLHNVNMGAVNFESGGDLVLNDNITVKQEWHTKVLANIQLKNDITIQTQNSDIQMSNAIDGHHALILNTGIEHIGNIHISSNMGETEALKSLSIQDAGACYIDGNIVTANGDVMFMPSVMLTRNLAINTGTGIGNIHFLDKIFSTDEHSYNLDLMSGGGDIHFMKDVGPNTPLGRISIEKARSIYVHSSFHANEISMTPFQSLKLGGSMTATNGNLIINGNVQTTQNQLHLQTLNGNISISGKISDSDNTHTLTINANTGQLNINDVSLGELTIAAADQGLQLSGEITVNDRFDTSNIAGSIVLKNHTAIRTRNTGDIVFTPTIDGPFNLAVDSKNGTVRINQSIGKTHRVRSFTIHSSESVMLADDILVSSGEIVIPGNISLLTDNITLDLIIGDIVLNGKLTDNDNDYQLNIKASAGNIYLWELDLAGIQLSASNKGLYLNGDIQVKNPFDTSEIVGPITIETPLSIKTESQDVVLKTDITLNGDLNINTGSEGGDIKIHGEINGRHAVSVAAGTGNIAFTKDIGNTDAVASVSVISGNTLSLNNVTAHGNIHMDNNHSINLHGNLQTLDAGSDIVVNNADIKMDGNRSIATNNGNIVLDAISPSKNDTQKLVLYAGEGNISIDQAIGQAELAFAEIDIMGATDIHLMGAETTVYAKSLQIASIGELRMDGKITLSGALNLNVNLLQINASIETNGDISIANSSGAIIDGNIQSGSQIHFTGPGKIELGGDILAEKSVRIDQSVLSLKSTHYIRSQTDEIVLHGISTETPGENIIQLNADKDITIKGPVGRSDQVMGGIHVVNARNLSFANTDETLYANTMTIQSVSNDTSFHGKICIFGDLNIDTKTMTILDSIETQNSGNISIITKDAVTMGSTITAGGKIHWQQQSDLMINDKLTATGSITFSGLGNIHLNADISITGNGANLIMDQSTLIVKGDHQLSTFNGDIKLKQIQTNTADDHVLTVSSENGNIDILDNVGSNTERMGGLVISDANKVAFSGQNASINVNTLNINNKDTLTIQSDIQSIGDLTFKGAGNILLGADLEVTGQDSNISILYSTVQLMSGCAIISHHGDIQLSDIIPQTNDAADLKLDANDNQIFLNGDTGRSGKALSGLDIVQADQVHVDGNIHISGDININARLLTVDKPIDAIDNGTIKMAITEEASINDKVTSDGNFEFQSTGKLVLNSTIETRQPASSIDIKAPLVLSKNSRIDTHGGDINLSDISSVSEESMLIMGSGQGNIAFNGSIGDTTQSVSDIQITSAKDISFKSTATAIYTDQLRIENKKGQTLIDAPLYVNADVMLTSATLTINADIHFSANANLTIITSGQTFLNADLQVPGNILFDGKGDIQLSGNLETTVPGKSIKAPDAAIIVSGNRSLTTQAGNIELAQISGDEITLNPAGANVEISGSVGTSDAPIAGINIVNAQDVAFISEHAKIYAADHLNIGAAGSAVFNGDIAVDNNMDINAKTLTIASHLNISKDVKFDIHGDISIMGIETNNQGNITLISQTGKMSLGRMNAGANGNIDLQAQQGIDGGSLIGNSVSIKAATIGAQIPPILDTQNFSATLTGVPGSAFAGHIKMASAGASLPKSSQINYLGTGLSLFIVEGMTVYGVDASDKSFYPMPVTDYEQHGLMRNAYMANRPEFFMIPPLNVDISIEADAEIEFLQMDYEM